MKKTLTIILSLVVIGGLSLINSCEGPEGPAGTPGADGINGDDGLNGDNGEFDEVCVSCHNNEFRDSIQMQYAASGHAAGEYVGYAGGRNGCAKCHSDQGFVETQFTGLDTTAADIALPQPIGCKTCHDEHYTFDQGNEGPDYALRTNGPVTLLMDETKTIDFEGPSNLCANCHQPRRSGPTDDGTGDFTITSTHWGPHHGPQSTILEGIGGYEIAGSASYPTSYSAHRTSTSCNSCHMPEAAEANTTGSHTFTPNLNSCTTCHSSATDFNVGSVQTEVEGLLEELAAAMTTAGMMVDGEIVPETYTVDQAGAYYNYATIVDDRSMGVHNPQYIKALLQNSIEVFN
jgi:hypothetical protein